jgi:uncharacterized damage-inducible protein DinB
MGPQAHVIWDALEFRTPSMLRVAGGLSEEQMRWLPPNGVNSIGWLLWHIAEVEDNWIREKLLNMEKQFPFGVSAKATPRPSCPPVSALIEYFHEVRAVTHLRLDAMADDRFDDSVQDETYGLLTVRQVWAGVATSCAWHGGQIAYVNRLLTG